MIEKTRSQFENFFKIYILYFIYPENSNIDCNNFSETNISNTIHLDKNSDPQSATETIEPEKEHSFHENDAIQTIEDEEGYCLLEVDWDGDDDNIIVLDDDDEDDNDAQGMDAHLTNPDLIRNKS